MREPVARIADRPPGALVSVPRVSDGSIPGEAFFATAAANWRAASACQVLAAHGVTPTGPSGSGANLQFATHAIGVATSRSSGTDIHEVVLRPDGAGLIGPEVRDMARQRVLRRGASPEWIERHEEVVVQPDLVCDQFVESVATNRLCERFRREAPDMLPLVEHHVGHG